MNKRAIIINFSNHQSPTNSRVGTDVSSGQLIPHSSVPLSPPLLIAPLAAVAAASSQADYRGTTRITLIPKARFFFLIFS